MTEAKDFVLAADIGGTHISAAMIDITNRKILLPLTRVEVDANKNTDEILTNWASCMLTAKTDGVSKICLAMPGPFNYEKGISLMQGQGKYDALFQLNVKELLAKALNTDAEKLFFENDAACFLHGEVFAGCATDGYHKVIGVTLGTGLGTAVYDNGKSFSADLWCVPFKETIAEDYLSTRWFVQKYFELTGNKLKGVKELSVLAASEYTARSIFSEFGKNLGGFLNDFIQRENAEAIVIGGNIARAYDLFKKELEENILDRFPSVNIKRSILGEQSTLYGAAGSWHSLSQRDLSISK